MLVEVAAGAVLEAAGVECEAEPEPLEPLPEQPTKPTHTNAAQIANFFMTFTFRRFPTLQPARKSGTILRRPVV